MTRRTPATSPMAPSNPGRQIAWATRQAAQHKRLAARAAANPRAQAMHLRHHDTAVAVIATLTALRDAAPSRRHERRTLSRSPIEAQPCH
tara:strand:+ start:17132 stop:17401 length:270 start_codon:yes stop_codon:yes gene_type:complete